MDLAHAIGHLAALGVDLDLNRWETEAPAVRPQKMTIPLSGTNYRAPRKTSSTPITDEPVQAFLPRTESKPAPSLNRTMVNTPTPMDTRKPTQCSRSDKPHRKPGCPRPEIKSDSGCQHERGAGHCPERIGIDPVPSATNGPGASEISGYPGTGQPHPPGNDQKHPDVPGIRLGNAHAGCGRSSSTHRSSGTDFTTTAGNGNPLCIDRIDCRNWRSCGYF